MKKYFYASITLLNLALLSCALFLIVKKSLFTSDSLVLKNGSGQTFASLASKNGVPTLELFDSAGKQVRLALIGGELPSIQFSNGNGSLLGSLHQLEDGGMQMVFTDLSGSQTLLIQNRSEVKMAFSDNSLGAQIGIEGESKSPYFILTNDTSKPGTLILGGKSPALALFNAQELPMVELKAGAKTGQIALKDAKGVPRLQCFGGDIPSMFLKNSDGEVVGTFLSLEGEGSGIGLGDAEGHVSTFLKGGSQPSLSFFQNSDEPAISLGITHSIPHMMILDFEGKEGMLIHGGAPTSLFFVTQEGNIPVILSKYGLYQDKNELTPPSAPPKKPAPITKKDSLWTPH